MKRILFVDDEKNVLDGLQRMLRAHRKVWQMVFVSSGAEALRALESQPFEVIVSDVRMPEMDGIQLLEHVQKHYPKMIRIVLSGYFEREAALRAAGVAHQYLAKPCDAVKLHETIDNLCRCAAILTNETARGVVSAIGSLPSPPRTYASLKQALQKPEVCLEEIGRIIQQDVGMTAKVLQMVNSPLFGLVVDITSIPRALGYIGLNTLRQLVLSVEIFQNFEPERQVAGFSLEEFQDHCRLAAKIAARLPAQADVAQISVIAALLHDAGKLVLAARLPEAFEEALKKSREENRPLYVVEEEVIGSTHAEVGAYLLSLWGLPQIIVDAVRSHHRPGAGQHAAGLDVLAITHISNALARELKAGVALDAPPADVVWDPGYLEELGVIRRVGEWRRLCIEIDTPVGAGNTI
jgi:putative nucleotidyltransferase with HDIG domain